MRHLPWLPVVTAGLLAACTPLWNAANRASLHSDVQALLAGAGASPQDLQCRMVATSRDGECHFRAGPQAARSLAQRLSLVPILVSSDTASAALARSVAPAELRAILSQSATFGIAGRPVSLRLGSGSAFEYLFLFQAPDRQTLWIRVSYAYG